MDLRRCLAEYGVLLALACLAPLNAQTSVAGSPSLHPGSGPRPQMVLQFCRSGQHAAFSPNGRLLATAGSPVQLWDARTGSVIRDLPTSAQYVAFSPNGRLLVTSESDYEHEATLFAWNTKTWARSRTWKTAWGCRVLFSPDGQWITAGVAKGRLGLLRVGAGRPQRILLPPSRRRFPEGFGGARLLLADSMGVGNTSFDGVAVYDWRAQRTVRLLPGEASAISRDGNLLATSGDRIQVQATRSGQVLWSARKGATALAFSPDAQLLFSSDCIPQEGTTEWQAWDARSGQVRKKLAGYDEVDSFSFDSSGSRVALVGTTPDGDGGSAPSLSVLDRHHGGTLWRAHASTVPVECLAFAPDGHSLALGLAGHPPGMPEGTSQGAVALWDLPSGVLRRMLWSGEELSAIRALAYSNESRLLAGAGGSPMEGSVSVWALASGKRVAVAAGAKSELTSVRFAGEQVIAGTGRVYHDPLATYGTPEVRRWSNRGGVGTPIASNVTLLAVSSDGNRLATAGRGNAAYLRPARKDGTALMLIGHQGAVNCATFSQDGTLLATGCEDRVPRVFDAVTGQLKRAFPGAHVTGVTAVAFSPDGHVLASAGRTVKLWEVDTGRLLRTIYASGPLAFSPDGRLLAVLSDPSGATLWDVATGTKRSTLLVLPSAQPEQKETEWLAYTTSGFYTGSPGAECSVRWRVGDRTYPAERFASEFKRPDRVRAALEAPR